jgi:hypothetical protein
MNDARRPAIRLETLMRCHRAGFRAYWRWKSRPRGGRPETAADIRRLIREMSVVNPPLDAPRIHGELLKLGIDVRQTTVAKYMARRRRPPSQGWKTFLRNHAVASHRWTCSCPTISFRRLYGFLILQHGRRELLWLGVTAHQSRISPSYSLLIAKILIAWGAVRSACVNEFASLARQ